MRVVPPRMLLTALVGAIVVASGLIATQGPQSLILPGLGLVIVVTLGALARLFPASGTATAMLAAAAYIGGAFLLSPFNDIRVGAAVAGVIGFGLVGVLADFLAARLYELVVQVNALSDTVDVLNMRNVETGTVKPQYIRTFLAEEVQRAKRYRRPISVLMIGLDPDYVAGPGVDLDEAFAKIGRGLVDRLRLTDKVSLIPDPARFLCVLVETPLAGAKLLAERLIEEIRVSTGVQFASGMATFPDDAINADALIEEASSALEFAALTGETLAHRDLLRAG